MQGRRFLFRPQLLAARIVEIARMPLIAAAVILERFSLFAGSVLR
jgi:hypothetical protein